jgi:hypothetical protein
MRVRVSGLSEDREATITVTNVGTGEQMVLGTHDGSARFVGLSYGTYTVSATSGRRLTSARSVTVDSEYETIRLKLRFAWSYDRSWGNDSSDDDD